MGNARGKPRVTVARSAGTTTRSRPGTARATRGGSAANRTKAYPAGKGQDTVVERAWLGVAHVAGGAARAFGPETLTREQRRDGVPFLLLILAVAGGAAEWFLRTNAVVRTIEAYSFGTIGRKWSAAHENYRLPNVVKGKMATDIPFPLGFDPKESITETDYAVSGGISGKTSDWNWDLSSTTLLLDLSMTSSINSEPRPT